MGLLGLSNPWLSELPSRWRQSDVALSEPVPEPARRGDAAHESSSLGGDSAPSERPTSSASPMIYSRRFVKWSRVRSGRMGVGGSDSSDAVLSFVFVSPRTLPAP